MNGARADGLMILRKAVKMANLYYFVMIALMVMIYIRIGDKDA